MKLVVKISISTFIWETIKTSHENSIQIQIWKGDPPTQKKNADGDFSQHGELEEWLDIPFEYWLWWV